MQLRWLTGFTLFFGLCQFAHAAPPAHQSLKKDEIRELCPHVHFYNTFINDFTPLEVTLVCGSPDVASWSDVPLNQARLFIRSFLEKRGFHHPVLQQTRDRLIIDPGTLTQIPSIHYQGLPEEIETAFKWDLTPQPLTPAALDQIENWARNQLRNHGYPCAELKLQANPDTGVVQVQIKPRTQRRIRAVEEKLDGALEPGVLSRFYAFRLGDIYNLENITLSRTRINSDGIVQTVFFDASCPDNDENGVIVKETIIAGPTNLVRAGVGGDLSHSASGNLEQGPEFTASWQKSRTDKRGSSVSVSGNANLRAQEFRALYKSYDSAKLPRLYTQPQITLRHENEETYSSRDLSMHYLLGYQWDNAKQNWGLTSGPSWRNSWSNRAGLSQTSRIISLEANGRTTTHEYETYLASPRTGYQMQAGVTLADPQIFSDVRAEKFTWRGHYLWNYRRYDPPRLIAAARWSLGTTLTRAQDRERLPPDFLYYLGGNQTLRAFDRKSLPFNGSGQLTSGYLGVELRWYKLMFRRLDPFLLADIGQLGGQSFQLDPDTYYDYGLGARWETGFGTFRLYVARGELHSDKKKMDPIHRVGFSFGEEF